MRYAICNETFDGWDFGCACASAALHGYDGIEIAPFTLAPLITDLGESRVAEIRKTATDAGLEVVGLHWLLAKTTGFSVTSPDPSVRKRTADYLSALVRCCRDMGGRILVFGSPQQRRIPEGHSLAEATDFACDTLTLLLPALEETQTTLALEPLAPTEADFMTTCAEACAILDRFRHPNLALHLDVKAMSSESVPVPDVIRVNIGRAAHFHANDANRRGPGFGDTDFRPIFKALNDCNYDGWVSVEVFDYSPDPTTIARECIRYMRECEPDHEQ